MMNRINNLLIGLLWLLASTLGATFWFNTMFGFNIFSLAHWQHLAYMQATGQAVKPTFYISIVVIVLVMLIGLYKLLQPRFRHITMPIFDRENSPAQSQTITTSTQTVVQPVAATKPAAPAPTETHTVTPPEQKPVETTTPVQTPTAPTTTSDPTLVRPPRLNIPTVTRTTPIPQVPLTTATPTTTPRANPETEYAEIRNIFESAGYVFKGMPKIKGVQTATVAIGTGEVLWIGGVGVTNADMRRAVQTMSDVFSDTLDDIEININAFIIGAPDANTAPDTDILQFANAEELRNYINERPNTPPDADESDNFDAYSGYIGTVMEYIGKI